MERKGLVKELIRDRKTVLSVMLVLSSWVNGPDERVGEVVFLDTDKIGNRVDIFDKHGDLVVFLVNVQDGHPMSRQDDAMGNWITIIDKHGEWYDRREGWSVDLDADGIGSKVDVYDKFGNIRSLTP